MISLSLLLRWKKHGKQKKQKFRRGKSSGSLVSFSLLINSQISAALLFFVIEKEKGISKIAACNLMLTKQGPLFLADTTININPSAKDLVKITQMTSNLVKMFGMKPNIAMLSFSNFGSINTETSIKIKEAVTFIHRHYPDAIVDGEIQADFALNPEMLAKEFPFSKLNGKKVNVLIFPNLESANITYKLLKQVQGAESIGPVILGLSKAVHVLQLGASVDEMVNMAALACVDVHQTYILQ